MIIPKEMIGRRVSILMEGLPVTDVKVTAVSATEILAVYDDEEETHIDPAYIRAWWPLSRKEVDHEKAKAAAQKALKTKKERGMIR